MTDAAARLAKIEARLYHVYGAVSIGAFYKQLSAICFCQDLATRSWVLAMLSFVKNLI